jgi:hypothetical protein
LSDQYSVMVTYDITRYYYTDRICTSFCLVMAITILGVVGTT